MHISSQLGLVLLTGLSLTCMVSVDHGGTQFRCEGSPECPPGQECINQTCVPLAVKSDAAPDTTRDATTADLVERQIVASADDAEENVTAGAVDLASTDLELVAAQVVGMRFLDITLERGEVVESAWIQFTTDEVSTEAVDLAIYAEASDSALAFTATVNDLSLRELTTALVAWQPEPWPTIGEGAALQRTPDLAALINEVTARDTWVSGGAIVIIVKGTGKRTAESYDGDGAAPILIIRSP